MVGGLNSIENGMLSVLLKYRKVKALVGWFGFHMYSYQDFAAVTGVSRRIYGRHNEKLETGW